MEYIYLYLLQFDSLNKCNKDAPTIFVILTGWNDKYNRNLPFYFVIFIHY